MKYFEPYTIYDIGQAPQDMLKDNLVDPDNDSANVIEAKKSAQYEFLKQTDRIRYCQPGDIYKHFKGNIYQVITIAIHTETKERLVIYYPLNNPTKVCARPLTMFMSLVDKEKYPNTDAIYRFKYLRKGVLYGDTEVSKA